jgi:uncharacterized protein
MHWCPEVRKSIGNSISEELQSKECKSILLGAIRRGDEVAAGHFFTSAMDWSTLTPDFRSTGSDSVPAQRMLLLQPVGDQCNLACLYCYEGERRQRGPTKRMSLKTLDNILENVLPHITLPFSIFVHGGEPLLAGKRFFLELAKRIRSYPNGDQITLGVQTNATLIDEGWIDIFQRLNMRIGVSIDGNRKIHDALRVHKDGSGSYAEVCRGIKLLQQHNLPFGAISIVSAPHVLRPGAVQEIYDHYVELGVRNFDIHPASTPSKIGREYNVSPNQYATFMKELFDAWVDGGDPGIRVRSIEHFFQAMAGSSAEVCYRAGKCTSIMGVRADGTAIPCTRPFSSKYDFGSLADSPLPTLQNSLGFKHFVSDERAGRDLTANCKWSSVCGSGGCPHERQSEGGQDITGRHVFCTCRTGETGGYPEVYEYYSTRVSEIMGVKPNPVGQGE